MQPVYLLLLTNAITLTAFIATVLYFRARMRAMRIENIKNNVLFLAICEQTFPCYLKELVAKEEYEKAHKLFTVLSQIRTFSKDVIKK